MIDNLHARRNVRLLQGHALFLNMMFLLPVLVPFYRDALGLGFREFIIGEAIFSATMVLMEVPSGWLSDVWTRKKTMIVGTLFHILGFAVLWQANGFWMSVMAQATLGVSVSLISGTNSALLYDSLLEAGEEGKYRRLEGFRHGLGLYAVGGASLAGGLLYLWHHDAPILLSIATSAVALILLLFVREPGRHKEPVHKHPLADMLATMRYALHGHAEVAGIILFSAALFAATKMLLWVQQPYYALLGLSEGWFGVLTAAGFLLGGLAGHFGHKLDHRFNNGAVLAACIGIVLVTCFTAGLWPGLYAVALILSGSCIWGFGFPRVQTAINRLVPSARRATILSTASLAIHVFSVPLFVLIGVVEGRHGITTALLALGGVVALGGLVGATLFYKSRSTMTGT